MGGVACIRGLRIPVAAVVGMIAKQLELLLRNLPALEGSFVNFPFLILGCMPAESAPQICAEEWADGHAA